MPCMKPLLLFLSSCLIATSLYAEAVTNCKGSIPKQTRQADIVVVGEVLNVGDAPGFWSGQSAALQKVSFRLKSVLKGTFTEPEFSVEYYVLHGSRLSAKEAPRLNGFLFKSGNALLLFLSVRNVGLPNDRERAIVKPAQDEECSVQIASAATVEAVKRAQSR